MQRLIFTVYRILRNILPHNVAQSIAASKSLKPLRDMLLRPNENTAHVKGIVQWQDITFRFEASYKVLYKAQNRGIENRICRLGRLILSEGGSALDIGANYGFVTMVLGKSLQPGYHLISFEINQEICPVLIRNCNNNDLQNHVNIVCQGAGSSKKGNMVPVDEIISEKQINNIRFMKIDVDGPELDVLQGARETLLLHQPVLVVELSRKKDEIYRFLQELGYCYFIDQSNQPVHPPNYPPNLIASFSKVQVPFSTNTK